MVSQEDIIKELKSHPQGILQTELAKKLNCIYKKRAYSVSYHNLLMSLLKRKDIRREKSKNSRYIIFLNDKLNDKKTIKGK